MHIRLNDVCHGWRESIGNLERTKRRMNKRLFTHLRGLHSQHDSHLGALPVRRIEWRNGMRTRHRIVLSEREEERHKKKTYSYHFAIFWLSRPGQVRSAQKRDGKSIQNRIKKYHTRTTEQQRSSRSSSRLFSCTKSKPVLQYIQRRVHHSLHAATEKLVEDAQRGHLHSVRKRRRNRGREWLGMLVVLLVLVLVLALVLVLLVVRSCSWW